MERIGNDVLGVIIIVGGLTVDEVIAIARSCHALTVAAEKWSQLMNIWARGFDPAREAIGYTNAPEWRVFRAARTPPKLAADATFCSRLKVAFTCYCGVTSWVATKCAACTLSFCSRCKRPLQNSLMITIINVMLAIQCEGIVCRFGCANWCDKCGIGLDAKTGNYLVVSDIGSGVIERVCSFCKPAMDASRDSFERMYVCRDILCRELDDGVKLQATSYYIFGGVAAPSFPFINPSLEVTRIYDPMNPRLAAGL
jgi:hypothetical protein